MLDKKWITYWVVTKIKIRSFCPITLSKIRNCFPTFVSWYLSGNTGISSLRRGAGGKSLSYRWEWIVRFNLSICCRFTSAVSKIFWRAGTKIFWSVSGVACDFCFINAFIFLTSIWSSDAGWVLLVNFPYKFTSDMKLYFCFTLTLTSQ